MQSQRIDFPRPDHFGHAARVVLLIVMAVAVGGCVQRRLTIRSNPPGARVYVGDEEVGTTPVSTDFVYYGTRKIRLVKPGYETLVVNQPIPTPWYQIPPLDFVSEILVPGEIRDERVVNFQLVPQQQVASEPFLARGEQARAATNVHQVSGAVPAVGPTLPPAGVAPGGGTPSYVLPEPATPGPANGPPTGQTTPIFPPPGGGQLVTPPVESPPAVPFGPPPYNPPQYLPPG